MKKWNIKVKEEKEKGKFKQQQWTQNRNQSGWCAGSHTLCQTESGLYIMKIISKIFEGKISASPDPTELCISAAIGPLCCPLNSLPRSLIHQRCEATSLTISLIGRSQMLHNLCAPLSGKKKELHHFAPLDVMRAEWSECLQGASSFPEEKQHSFQLSLRTRRAMLMISQDADLFMQFWTTSNGGCCRLNVCDLWLPTVLQSTSDY